MGRRGLAVAGLVLAIVLVAGWTKLATASTGTAAAPASASASPTPSASPSYEITRLNKIGLINSLTQAPGLLVLGSSRAMRVDPAYLQQLTGRTGFNCAVSSGSIADAWSFIQYVHDRFPGCQQRYLWLLDAEQFRVTRVHRAILAIPQLAGYIPPAFWPAGATPAPTPTPTIQPPYGSRSQGPDVSTSPSPGYGNQWVFASDGNVIWNMYDYMSKHGRTLNNGLAFTYRKYAKIYPNGYGSLRGVPKWFMEHTIALMNSWGVQPVIVLTPYHPKLLRFITKRGFEKRHQDVLAYFQKLKEKYQFVLLDFTSIKSFGGWKSGFYDGVHPKALLSGKISLQAVLGSGGALQ